MVCSVIVLCVGSTSDNMLLIYVDISLCFSLGSQDVDDADEE